MLDTSVVIDLPVIPDERLPLQATISAVTLAELSQGPYLATDDLERTVRTERLQIAEAVYRAPLPFDAAAARRYGAFVGLVVGSGRRHRSRRIDLMIAATAAVHGLPLYTRNADDFAGLERALVVVAT